MGQYLSREAILSAGFRTVDVEAFGGTVLVREVPADLVQEMIGQGLMDPQTREIDVSKADLVQVAARCIVDPQTHEPVFSQADLGELGKAGFGGITRVATAAMQLIAVREGGSEDERPN